MTTWILKLLEGSQPRWVPPTIWKSRADSYLNHSGAQPRPAPPPESASQSGGKALESTQHLFRFPSFHEHRLHAGSVLIIVPTVQVRRQVQRGQGLGLRTHSGSEGRLWVVVLALQQGMSSGHIELFCCFPLQVCISTDRKSTRLNSSHHA